MTLNQARHVSDSQSTRSKTRPRLRLKPKAPTTGYVDGAWWPRSNDIAVELPDLLAVLSVRLGPIEQVIFNVGDWAHTQTEFAIGDQPVRLGASTGQPVDTIQIIGDNHKLVLLVVPPGTDRALAHAAMMSAAAPDNASTIEDLLRVMIENGS
jgi:uncharacterized protein DUF5994